MSFDPMSAATDWLDAYRSGDLEAILKMYADNAVIECDCGTMTTIAGKEAFRAYWQQRFKDCAASDLDEVEPSRDGTTVSLARGGVVAASLQFNKEGQIVLLRLGLPK